jgi:uncharacterized membrane protein
MSIFKWFCCTAAQFCNLTRKYSDRFLLLDVMRAFAVFMMIQGHTIDALLSPTSFNDANPLFHVWQYGRGLTAPIFLFGSGFAYVIANTRKSIGGRLPFSTVLRRLRWIGVLFLLGSLMHFPVPTVSQIAGATAEKWSSFYHVDVLRLMAVTLLGLLFIFLFARKLRHILYGSLSAMALIVSVSPLIHGIHWSRFMHEYFCGYFSMETGSFFPVFPFSAYLFAGAAAAALYMQWKANGTDHLLMRRFFVTGVFSVVFSVGCQIMFVGQGYDNASPLYFILRIGSVLVLWSVIGVMVRSARVMPAIIPILGQHTLLIYVSHVTALYGCAWFLGLSAFIGKSLPFLPVLGIIAVLLVSTSMLAYRVHEFRAEQHPVYRMAPYVGMALLTLLFSNLISIY